MSSDEIVVPSRPPWNLSNPSSPLRLRDDLIQQIPNGLVVLAERTDLVLRITTWNVPTESVDLGIEGHLKSHMEIETHPLDRPSLSLPLRHHKVENAPTSRRDRLPPDLNNPSPRYDRERRHGPQNRFNGPPY